MRSVFVHCLHYVPECPTDLISSMAGDFHIFCQIIKSLRKLIVYSCSIIVWSVLYYEKKTHIIDDNPCICTAGGIIREGGYYLYKEKDQPAECLIIVERVLQNDSQKTALLIYFPQPDRRIEISHFKTDPVG